MTREDIIRMAQECQLIGMRPHLDGIYQESLERFAALVAAAERESWPAEMETMERQVNILTDALAQAVAAEREACAKWLDERDAPHWAEQIRARGQA